MKTYATFTCNNCKWWYNNLFGVNISRYMLKRQMAWGERQRNFLESEHKWLILSTAATWSSMKLWSIWAIRFKSLIFYLVLVYAFLWVFLWKTVLIWQLVFENNTQNAIYQHDTYYVKTELIHGDLWIVRIFHSAHLLFVHRALYCIFMRNVLVEIQMEFCGNSQEYQEKRLHSWVRL